MSSRVATTFSRTLLTSISRSTRLAASTTRSSRPRITPVSTPLRSRNFSATSKMADQGDTGVHNLQSKSAFDEVLAEKDKLIVVDCFATWCGPCKVIAPQVVKMAKTYPNAKFLKLDVDEVPDVAQELAVRAMPTFLLFKNSEKVGEVVGANPKALEAAITKHL